MYTGKTYEGTEKIISLYTELLLFCDTGKLENGSRRKSSSNPSTIWTRRDELTKYQFTCFSVKTVYLGEGE